MAIERLTIKELQKIKAARLNVTFEKLERAIKAGTLKQVAPPKTA